MIEFNGFYVVSKSQSINKVHSYRCVFCNEKAETKQEIKHKEGCKVDIVNRLIKALLEDDYTYYSDSWGYSCSFCGHKENKEGVITHSDDCVLILAEKLKS